MSTPSSITQCTNCNGELTFNPAAQTLDCPFCNSTYTLHGEAIKTEAAMNETPQLIIPFAFAKEVFDKAAMEWLSQGDYTPADVLDSFRSASTKGVYVPLYIWRIDYIQVSSMGNKPGYTVAVANGEVTKNWPAELNSFAKSSVNGKSHSKPFDKVYTLGFDVWDDDVSDIGSFNKKAQALALQSILAANSLTDSKTIVINKMELTKVYAAFWVNKYSYRGQNHEVIMSGFGATNMGGTRPVDNVALNAKKPSVKTALYLFLSGIALLILDAAVTGKWPKNITTSLSVVSFLMFMLAAPVAFVVTMIRASRWTDPVIKLKKEREQKLAQRLA